MKFTQCLGGAALPAAAPQPRLVPSIQICSPVAESDRPRPFGKRTLVETASGGSICVSISAQATIGALATGATYCTQIEELPILGASVAKHRELA